MRRTENRLKSKGIKAKNFSNAHACKGIKYERHYVARKYGDAKRLPFSRGSWVRYADWDWNPRVYNCLYGFLRKQVGKAGDVVFHHFSKLISATTIVVSEAAEVPRTAISAVVMPSRLGFVGTTISVPGASLLLRARRPSFATEPFM